VTVRIFSNISFSFSSTYSGIFCLVESDVVIEFGHNDGGSPDTSDRASVGGEGTDTQTITLANGTVEVVQTFSTYLRRMIADAKAKGATPIISSQTPNNPYENSDTIVYSPPRFVPYAQNVAVAAAVPFANHFNATYLYYQKLGKATVDAYYPNDHTHTNTEGANSVAWAFLSSLRCTLAKGALASYVNTAGQGAGARC
jgi:rhamnogalacturonan acetylesterase